MHYRQIFGTFLRKFHLNKREEIYCSHSGKTKLLFFGFHICKVKYRLDSWKQTSRRRKRSNMSWVKNKSGFYQPDYWEICLSF